MLHLFSDLPVDFYQHFSYLTNLGSLSVVVNFDTKKTEELLAKFYEQIEEVPYIQPNIYGLSSLGILLNYLAKVDESRFREYEEEFVEDFSDVILEASQAMADRLEYDTFTGLVSTLNFFVLTKQTENVLTVIDMLQKVAQQLFEENKLNDLGISHGVGGIIAIMAKAMIFLEKRKIVEDTINKYKNTLQLITNHVINQKETIGNFCFPSVIGGSSSRLAWCYGDLSVCVALTWAALILPNKSEIDEVVKQTINNAINIKDDDRVFNKNEETKEYDLGLCHGFSGVYLVFKRLYEFYPSNQLAEEIKRLKKVLDKQIEKGTENINFPVYIKAEPITFEWKNNLLFLEGLSGFLAAYHDDELVKGWDAPLLTDF